MNTWPLHNLGDFFRVKHGFAFKGKHFGREGNYIVLTPGNFQAEGGLKMRGEKEKFYLDKPPADFILKRGDLLTVMTDLTQEARILGASAVVPTENLFLHNQRLGKITDLETDKLNKNYLYHLFNWEGVRAQIRASATGSTVRHTAPDRIYAVTFPLPSLPIQKRIAGILSAYDDLIEVNMRRIAILEETARRIYHTAAVTFSGEMIELPSVAEITYGFPFKSKQFSEEPVGLGVIRIRDVKKHQASAFTDELGKPQHMVHAFDILIGMDGEFHMSIWAGPVAWLNQRVARLRPAKSGGWSTGLLFETIRQPISHLNDTIVGTTVAHLSARDLKALQVPRFSTEDLEALNERLEPMASLAMTLRAQNANLRAQRDLLLPRLVSGRLDVSDLDELEAATDDA